MTDLNTKLLIEAQMKGVQQVLDQARKIKTAFGGEQLGKEIKGLKDQLDAVKAGATDSTKKAKDFNKEVKALGASARSIRDLARAFQSLGSVQVSSLRAQSQAQARLNRLQQQAARANRPPPNQSIRGFAAGAGVQGIVQGIQQGGLRGLGQYAGGFVGGRGLRAFARGGAALAGTPFTGSGGALRALSSVPIVGGAAAGILQSGLATAEESLGLRAQVQQLFGLAGAPPPGALPASLQQGALQSTTLGSRRGAARQALTDRLVATGRGVAGGGGLAPIPFTRTSGTVETDPVVRDLQAQIEDLRGTESTAARRQRADGRIAGLLPGRNFLERTAGGANQFGFQLQEALNIRTQLSRQVGGGLETGLESSAFVRALQAQRGLGLGADVIGGFARGARTGGILSTDRPGETFDQFGARTFEDTFSQAIQDGTRLGLEGTDLNRFLADIAQNIQSFATTGIPINPRSATGLALAFQTGGIGGPERANVAGQALGGFLRNIGQTGNVSSRLRVLAAQEFGGLADRPDAEQLLQSRLRLSQQNLSPDEFQDRLRSFIGRAVEGAGGGAAGEQAFLAELQREGIQGISLEDIVALNRTRSGAALPAGFERQFIQRNRRGSQALARGAAATRGGTFAGSDILGQRARSAVDPAVARAAEQANRRAIAASTTLLNTAQNFSEVNTRAIQSLSSFGRALDSATRLVADASRRIQRATENYIGPEIQ